MVNSEAGWTKEWPSERGFYWARETPDDINVLLVEIHANRLTICGGTKLNVKEAFEGSEFLGPLSPSDAEQLSELKKEYRTAMLALKETAFSYHVEAEHKTAFSACTNIMCGQACRLFNTYSERVTPKQSEKETQQCPK